MCQLCIKYLPQQRLGPSFLQGRSKYTRQKWSIWFICLNFKEWIGALFEWPWFFFFPVIHHRWFCLQIVKVLGVALKAINKQRLLRAFLQGIWYERDTLNIWQGELRAYYFQVAWIHGRPHYWLCLSTHNSDILEMGQSIKCIIPTLLFHV